MKTKQAFAKAHVYFFILGTRFSGKFGFHQAKMGSNQPIGIVSTMLYEIDEKHYCSKCYFQIITNNAP
ncbi:MAG: hypothetical protein ABSB10_02850 [Candidatus Bathyarchaeia archaeon]